MFDKSFLVNKVINILNDNEFETFLTHGSFDIVARREHLMLIKTLLNVDALDERHALDLRAISYFLSAYPFIVSLKTNRDFLNKSTIYSRFELPVLTPDLFKSMLEEDEIIVTQSSKGRHTQEINTFILKEKRKELKFSLEELASQIGISKKAMYEIENNRVNPQRETVRMLEGVLGIELTLPYEMKHVNPVYLKPRSKFQEKVSKEFSRIGIDNSSVNSAPFKIVGKESFSLITNLLTISPELEKEIIHIKQLSSIFSSKAVLISKKHAKSSIGGIPTISETELNELNSSRELGKIIDERIS